MASKSRRTGWGDSSSWTVGILVGIAIGVSLGIAMGNIALGIGIGVAIGVVFAIAFSQSKKSEQIKRDSGADSDR